MLFLQYLTLIIVLYLAPLLGMFLAFIAPEELADAQKYLRFLQKITIIIIIILLFYYPGFDIFTIILSLLLFVLVLITRNEQTVVFCLLGIVFYASLSNMIFLKNVSILIFIFGLMNGLLYTSKYQKNNKINKQIVYLVVEIMLKYLLFIPVALIPYWIF